MLEESLLKFKQTNKDFDKDFFRFQRHEEANFKHRSNRIRSLEVYNLWNKSILILLVQFLTIASIENLIESAPMTSTLVNEAGDHNIFHPSNHQNRRHLSLQQFSTISSSSSTSSTPDYSSVEDLAFLINEANLENRCDLDQDRKDRCEMCIRFIFERSVGYLGCCTNYDGIYDFCDNFLNYSFDDQKKK
ncbi:hypothetical protein NH340_JMT06208 [Sarcoptes scabiei]|nr:hypothetical protein NH340_JMT06208 [Sarcoptes scabiei]